MATTTYQQPPSPPHRRPHYFPPSSVMLHAPPPPNVIRYTPQPQQQQQQHHPHQSRPQSQVTSRSPVVRAEESSPLVRSRLPTGLPERTQQTQDDDEAEGLQEATITWRGNAREVYLTGVADRAHERVRMHYEPGSKSTFFTTIRLPPGNHPLRFIVDDQQRCTDTLPTATDADGTLINYIEIASPTHSPRFDENPLGGPDGACRTFDEMRWTDEIPPRLFKLAAAEEAYLAARAAAASPPPPPQNPTRGGTHHQQPPSYQPIPSPPPVPYPPSLPRHLEKVILNNSSSKSSGSHTPAILASSSSNRPRIIGTGTTGPLIPAPAANGRSRLLPTGLAAPPVPHATLPGTNMVLPAESLGDDNSVLPVPNHVVLNHLGTSAIKNGVLAVGTTTRYHRKYISTIYYKPI